MPVDISHHFLRTYNISGRKEWVKWYMLAVYITFVSMEWFTNLYQRHRAFALLCVSIFPIDIPMKSIAISDATSVGQSTGNCAAGNSSVGLSAWLYYILAMVYDLVCITISTLFLFSADTRNRRLTRILKM